MPKFEGCEAGREISFVKRGANPHTSLLVRKNKTPSENLPMTDAEKAAAALESAKTLKALAGMSDLVKGYVAKMPDDKVHEFMRMAPADQEEEAMESDAAKKKEAEAAKALADGKTAKEIELEKSVSSLRAEMETLKAEKIESDIEKRANTEFAGFPGGAEKVIPLLKAYAGLPKEAREASEAVLKGQIDLAKKAGATYGKTEDELAKFAPAGTEVATKAAELAKTKGMTLDKAKGQVLADDPDLMARAFAEEQSQHAN